MNVLIRAMERIFSLGERWNDSIQLGFASLSGPFYLSPRENILTIALINIHYLFPIQQFLYIQNSSQIVLEIVTNLMYVSD